MPSLDAGGAARRVVVAVDGSPASRAALRRAAEEAVAHVAALHVVLAWGLLEQPWGKEFDPHISAEAARRYLDDVVTSELGIDPLPTLTLEVVNDLPARAVLDAADGAWLVVLGNRGLGGFRGLLLGSVSQQVVHHATCPVLIVRAGSDDADHGAVPAGASTSERSG